MEFGKDISKLSDADLPRYKTFLLDKLCGVIQSEERRMKLLVRIEQVEQEQNRRKNR